jgi:hypothetical protein
LDLEQYRILLTKLGYMNIHNQHDVSLCEELYTTLLNVRESKEEKPASSEEGEA